MGAWGLGLYSGDFASDLKTTVAAVCRLPLDDEALVEAVCQSERSVAADPTNPDHTIFWLVLADQFEKRGIFSPYVRETALAIIDSGNDTAAMRALGMKPADMRKRMVQLAALRARLLAQLPASRDRKIIKEPEPYVFELHGVYAYPTRGGSAINPYMPAKRFDRAAWSPDGFGLMLIVGRGRAFGYLAWYSAVKVAEVAATVPEGDALALDIRWAAPPFYGTCNRAHFRKLELREVGIFRLDPVQVDYFFPHLAHGNAYAVSDISIANGMKIGGRASSSWWRRPDGRMEPIVFPSAPNLVELALEPGISLR